MPTSDFGLLELDAWDHLGPAECEVVARDEVEPQLPEPFRFDRVAFCELGDQRRHVAFFDWNGSAFALIPGGTITLGYDRGAPFQPGEAEALSWALACEEDDENLTAYLDRVMSPLRAVDLAPYLIEVGASEAGKRPLHGRSEARPGESVMQVGDREFYAFRPISQRAVADRLAIESFRLPTSDEWEHACSAGSRTLFRWGPHSPTGKEWAEDATRRPNAFGLGIAHDSYKWEFCSDPAIMRGGDGGSSSCGGMGELAVWLALASPFLCRIGGGGRGKRYGGYVRRVFPLEWRPRGTSNSPDDREPGHDDGNKGFTRNLRPPPESGTA